MAILASWLLIEVLDLKNLAFLMNLIIKINLLSSFEQFVDSRDSCHLTENTERVVSYELDRKHSDQVNEEPTL